MHHFTPYRSLSCLSRDFRPWTLSCLLPPLPPLRALFLLIRCCLHFSLCCLSFPTQATQLPPHIHTLLHVLCTHKNLFLLVHYLHPLLLTACLIISCVTMYTALPQCRLIVRLHLSFPTNPNILPILPNTDTVTSESLQEFQIYCAHFFATKKISAANCVLLIASIFRDLLILTWYFTNANRLQVLTMKEFMQAFRDY